MDPDYLQFDINRAKRGWPVVTRSGIKVNITSFTDTTLPYFIEGMLEDKVYTITWAKNGQYSLQNPGHDLDLFLLKVGAETISDTSLKTWENVFQEFTNSEECKTAGPAEKFKALTRWLDAYYPLKYNNHDQ